MPKSNSHNAISHYIHFTSSRCGSRLSVNGLSSLPLRSSFERPPTLFPSIQLLHSPICGFPLNFGCGEIRCYCSLSFFWRGILIERIYQIPNLDQNRNDGFLGICHLAWKSLICRVVMIEGLADETPWRGSTSLGQTGFQGATKNFATGLESAGVGLIAGHQINSKS